MKYQIVDILASGVVDDNGFHLSGGNVYITEAGSSSIGLYQIPCYADANGAVAITQPIKLNANGTAKVYINSKSAKIWIKDSNYRLIRTIDDVEITRAEASDRFYYEITNAFTIDQPGIYTFSAPYSEFIAIGSINNFNPGDRIVINKFNNIHDATIQIIDSGLNTTQFPYIMKYPTETVIIRCVSQYNSKTLIIETPGLANNSKTVGGYEPKLYDTLNTFIPIAGGDTWFINPIYIPILSPAYLNWSNQPPLLANNVFGLTITNDSTTPDSRITISVLDCILYDTSQSHAVKSVKLGTFSLILDVQTNGLNGLDVGTIANNNWYDIYVIMKDDKSDTGSIACLSSDSPVLPTGYTYKLKVGSFYYTGDRIRKFYQKDNVVMYNEKANIISGGATANAWAEITTKNNFFPVTAKKLILAAHMPSAVASNLVSGVSTLPTYFGGSYTITYFGASVNTTFGGLFDVTDTSHLHRVDNLTSGLYYFANNSNVCIVALGWEY